MWQRRSLRQRDGSNPTETAEQFNFQNPDDWTRWMDWFKQFRVASGLADEDAAWRMTMLLYCMGEQAQPVLDSTKPMVEERKGYTKVLDKFSSILEFTKMWSTIEHISIAEYSYQERARSNTSWLCTPLQLTANMGRWKNNSYAIVSS